MRIIIGLLAALLLPLTVGAFAPQAIQPAKQYEEILIEIPEEGQAEYLGILDNSPVMYEFTITSSTTLPIQLAQKYSGKPVPFSLMVVRVLSNGKGVQEVARLRSSEDGWTPYKQSWLGFTLLESEALEPRLSPGVYRVEVNTPDNVGRYMVTFGEESIYQEKPGYFETLGHVRTTQKHFGYSFLRMLMSSYVYYPLGIFFLLFVLQRTWKYRKLISMQQ